MKFEGNILGKMRQQIGKSFVFTIWKGVQVAKQYAKPSNPRTTKQVNQRSKFSTVLIVAQMYTIALIDTYWRKFAIKMSAFNAFMQANLNAVGYPVDYTKFIFSKGSLYAQTLTSATYADGTGATVFKWPTTLQGNQLEDDNMQLIILNRANNAVYYSESNILRNAGTAQFTIPTGLDFGQLHAYLFAYRNLGATNEAISNSGYHTVSEP